MVYSVYMTTSFSKMSGYGLFISLLGVLIGNTIFHNGTNAVSMISIYFAANFLALLIVLTD
jgi:hypothetical protein